MAEPLTPEEKKMIVFVNLAASSYPSMQNKDPLPVVKSWVLMLGGIPDEILKAAVIKVCRSSEFFPSVAQIVAAAREFSQEPEPTAEEAWGEVTAEIQRAGHNLPTKFSTPTVRRAVDAIGWHNLCMSENIMADRVHFLKIYESMRGRSAARQENEAVLQIAGAGDFVKQLTERMVKV
jgi:hypothetical protein